MESARSEETRAGVGGIGQGVLLTRSPPQNGTKRGSGVSPQEAEPETQCGGAGEPEHSET